MVHDVTVTCRDGSNVASRGREVVGRWSGGPAGEAWGRIQEIGLVRWTTGVTAEVPYGVLEEYMRWYGAPLAP